MFSPVGPPVTGWLVGSCFDLVVFPFVGCPSYHDLSSTRGCPAYGGGPAFFGFFSTPGWASPVKKTPFTLQVDCRVITPRL